MKEVCFVYTKHTWLLDNKCYNIYSSWASDVVGKWKEDNYWLRLKYLPEVLSEECKELGIKV
jgi:hypothetical protein